jgi:hypothetical protein
VSLAVADGLVALPAGAQAEPGLAVDVLVFPEEDGDPPA